MLDLLDAPRFVEGRKTTRKGHSQPKWTNKELEILKDKYPRAPKEDVLAALPGRNWNAIKVKATNTGIRRSLDVIESGCGERWTTGELALLSAIYPNAPQHVIEAVWPDHTWSSIQSCACRQRITRIFGVTRVSTEDRAIILELNSLGKAETLRRLPHLTWNFIRKKAFDMGVEVNVLPAKDLEILWSMYMKGYERKHILTMLGIPAQTYGRALNYLKKKHNYQD